VGNGEFGEIPTHPREAFCAEIKGVIVGDRENEVKEEDLHKMPYLKGSGFGGFKEAPTCAFLVATRGDRGCGFGWLLGTK
jgi:hypothetical protein